MKYLYLINFINLIIVCNSIIIKNLTKKDIMINGLEELYEYNLKPITYNYQKKIIMENNDIWYENMEIELKNNKELNKTFQEMKNESNKTIQMNLLKEFDEVCVKESYHVIECDMNYLEYLWKEVRKNINMYNQEELELLSRLLLNINKFLFKKKTHDSDFKKMNLNYFVDLLKDIKFKTYNKDQITDIIYYDKIYNNMITINQIFSRLAPYNIEEDYLYYFQYLENVNNGFHLWGVPYQELNFVAVLRSYAYLYYSNYGSEKIRDIVNKAVLQIIDIAEFYMLNLISEKKIKNYIFFEYVNWIKENDKKYFKNRYITTTETDVFPKNYNYILNNNIQIDMLYDNLQNISISSIIQKIEQLNQKFDNYFKKMNKTNLLNQRKFKIKLYIFNSYKDYKLYGNIWHIPTNNGGLTSRSQYINGIYIYGIFCYTYIESKNRIWNLNHELTHGFFYGIYGNGYDHLPIWMIEGVANVLGKDDCYNAAKYEKFYKNNNNTDLLARTLIAKYGNDQLPYSLGYYVSLSLLENEPILFDKIVSRYLKNARYDVEFQNTDFNSTFNNIYDMIKPYWNNINNWIIEKIEQCKEINNNIKIEVQSEIDIRMKNNYKKLIKDILIFNNVDKIYIGFDDVIFILDQNNIFMSNIDRKDRLYDIKVQNLKKNKTEILNKEEDVHLNVQKLKEVDLNWFLTCLYQNIVYDILRKRIDTINVDNIFKMYTMYSNYKILDIYFDQKKVSQNQLSVLFKNIKNSMETNILPNILNIDSQIYNIDDYEKRIELMLGKIKSCPYIIKPTTPISNLTNLEKKQVYAINSYSYVNMINWSIIKNVSKEVDLDHNNMKNLFLKYYNNHNWINNYIPKEKASYLCSDILIENFKNVSYNNKKINNSGVIKKINNVVEQKNNSGVIKKINNVFEVKNNTALMQQDVIKLESKKENNKKRNYIENGVSLVQIEKMFNKLENNIYKDLGIEKYLLFLMESKFIDSEQVSLLLEKQQKNITKILYNINILNQKIKKTYNKRISLLSKKILTLENNEDILKKQMVYDKKETLHLFIIYHVCMAIIVFFIILFKLYTKNKKYSKIIDKK